MQNPNLKLLSLRAPAEAKTVSRIGVKQHGSGFAFEHSVMFELGMQNIIMLFCCIHESRIFGAVGALIILEVSSCGPAGRAADEILHVF